MIENTILQCTSQKYPWSSVYCLLIRVDMPYLSKYVEWRWTKQNILKLWFFCHSSSQLCHKFLLYLIWLIHKKYFRVGKFGMCANIFQQRFKKITHLPVNILNILKVASIIRLRELLRKIIRMPNLVLSFKDLY